MPFFLNTFDKAEVAAVRVRHLLTLTPYKLSQSQTQAGHGHQPMTMARLRYESGLIRARPPFHPST